MQVNFQPNICIAYFKIPTRDDRLKNWKLIILLNYIFILLT